MTAAWGGLKPAPDSRLRRASRHLPYSLLRRTVSRPGELHPQPLVERYVNLSTHTAPIGQTRRSSRCGMPKGRVVIRISSWTVQLDTDQTTRRRPFAPSPLQRLHHYYERLRPSASHRYSGSCGVNHLNGSLRIETTGSRSSVEKPGSDSRHLHAGHRLGSLQGNPQTSPDGITLHRFRCHVLVHDESTVVHLRSSF